MTDEVVDSHKMPLLDHLIELRQRLLRSVIALFVAFFISFFFAEYLYNFLVQPLADILLQRGDERMARMIFTDLTEVFFTYVKVFLQLLDRPIFLLQIQFVAPGLYA